MHTLETCAYKKYDKQSQIIFNAKETSLYDLVEHPEW